MKTDLLSSGFDTAGTFPNSQLLTFHALEQCSPVSPFPVSSEIISLILIIQAGDLTPGSHFGELNLRQDPEALWTYGCEWTKKRARHNSHS